VVRLGSADGGVEGIAAFCVAADGDDPCLAFDWGWPLKDGGVAGDFDSVRGVFEGGGACEEGRAGEGDDGDGRAAVDGAAFLVFGDSADPEGGWGFDPGHFGAGVDHAAEAGGEVAKARVVLDHALLGAAFVFALEPECYEEEEGGGE
jgi:hypothetical protein